MGRITWAVVATAGIGLAGGCGGPSDRQAVPVTNKDALAELGQFLKTLAEQRQPPPAKMADLEQIEPMIPVAWPVIRNGGIVYLFGAGYQAGGDKVVAHDKKASTEGGSVLLQSGEVREMTAAEFAAAPKAGKK